MRNYVILLVVSVVLLAATGYAGYQYGQSSANEVCLQATLEREKKTQEYLEKVSSELSSISASSISQEEQLKEDMSEILARLKKNPVTVVKNGKCTPSTTFLNSIDEAVNRANAK